MDIYQFFFSDAAGDVTGSWQFPCTDAHAAKTLMRNSMDGAATAEVWCGARLIGEEDAWARSAIAAVAAFAQPADRRAATALDHFQQLWNRRPTHHV